MKHLYNIFWVLTGLVLFIPVTLIKYKGDYKLSFFEYSQGFADV